MKIVILHTDLAVFIKQLNNPKQAVINDITFTFSLHCLANLRDMKTLTEEVILKNDFFFFVSFVIGGAYSKRKQFVS